MNSAYPVAIQAPDIDRYREGNTGLEYVSTFVGAATGPHVLLAAVVHGNELCGALALDFLLRAGLKPVRGSLTFAFMNPAAYALFDAADPDATRWVDEDFNRVWDIAVLDGPRNSIELARARALRGLIDRVDFLLDIHSMQHPTEALTICGPTHKGRALARAIGFPAFVVADEGHAAGRRMRDYGAFGDESSPKNALLVECGQHWSSSSEQVAREMALRFLAHFDMLDPGFLRAHLPTAPLPRQRVVEITWPITISADRFVFAAEYKGMEVVPRAGTLLGYDGENEVRTPYDNCVLIMPSRRLWKGQTAVRLGRFVDD